MTEKKIKLELLAPAKNYEFGVAAINCGADALYIGAPDFGARKAASNSVEDIAKLVKYAHLFDVKVYVAFNTIIFDSEIEDAQRLVNRLYEIGVDALIVQDMAFAKMNIPPIRLFASTQTTNLDIDRVKFLEGVGFERVILERALPLSQIKQICDGTSLDVECFVHGAICVSYSGNCYISQYITGRSANRGVCAQPCRSTYDLVDEDDNIILKNSHILSLKDLSLAENLDDLINAGVTSFKIEGRLKDLVYLKNNVTFFNDKLNKFISSNSKYARQSKGHSIVNFEANPSKSFSRMFTSYFFNEKQKDVASFSSAKSFGEYIGIVKQVTPKGIIIEKQTEIELVSGDGICFVSQNGDFSGTYVNKANNNVLELAKTDIATIGSKVFRNLNKKFVDTVSVSVEKRLLKAKIIIEKGEAKIIYNDFVCSEKFEYENAQNKQKALEGLIQNFSKTATSIFEIVAVEVEGDNIPFLPIKLQNSIRNLLFDRMTEKILDNYIPQEGRKLKIFPLETFNVTYKQNIANKLSRNFYEECGVKNIEDAVEVSNEFTEIELMRMAYCIRKEIGICLKEKADKRKLFLINNGRQFKLKFDCSKCEMIVTKL